MNRAWFLVLAVSVGLNAAMLYQHFMRPMPPHRAAPGSRGEFAPGPPGPRGAGEDRLSPEEMMEHRLHRMGQELALTESQAQAIRSIDAAAIDEMDSLRGAARGVRSRIRDLLGAGQLDSAAIRAASDTLQGINARIESRITDNLIHESRVLTPEQRPRYLEMMRWGARRDRRGPRR